MEKLKVPASLLDLSEKDRNEILKVLAEASKLPKVKKHGTGDEHNIWLPNADPLLAQAEDGLYQEMLDPWTHNMADLFIGLGLTLDGVELKKSLDDFEELTKAKDSGRTKMSDLIKANNRKRKQFMKWVQDGKAMAKAQLDKLDSFLRQDLPDYAKKAEDFMTRAGYIGKVRNQAERENFEVLSGYLDRVPKTIQTARNQGVVLTMKHKAKEEAKGNKVKVLPLTAQEAEAVTHASHHAGDKLSEISERHVKGVRQLVIQAKRERWSAQQLAQALFDKYGEHNRDWRRVAITELSFATNDAYLSGLDEGERVVGMGSANACKHCKNLVIGREFTLTHKHPSEESYATDMKIIWAGKSNYGRRVAEWRACIPVHPNCRCRWHRISRFYNVDKGGTFKRKTTEELIQEERAKRGLPPDPKIEEKLKRIREQMDE